MSKVISIENGCYIFKLDDLLQKHNLSKNQLMRDTDTDFKVIQRLCNGNESRIDLFVVARLCNYFNCPLSDIIEYVPNSK